MKLNINWKLFLILFVTSIIASVLVLPYALALSPALASVFTPVVLIAQLIQSIILFAIAILVGLTLYKRVGFKIPILEGWLEGKEVGNYFKSILGISVELGVLAGVLIILFSFIFTSASSILQGAELTVPVWKSFLASFYGGIGEEILFRLFVMTVIVWIFYKIKKTPEGKPTTVGIWLAIIITAILFGVGHLPITGSITAITPLVIARAIVLNGIGAIIFGWLYWKKGLESAMISHFSADIVLHVMFPLILSSLI
ncbi:CPBP family intramembrane glutamic endopeptidase [Methanobacterium subterraneum]|uniref:CAAX protease family protein n=1 Tax=Methanobacterium subterraneum TaxID=59277 RepID=A0A2H4VA28_9EURY|nr:CPBP family intramembrane glutamic endopeptidase [Methanobacterium subterraneum]AUB54954.1 CAAX protease family protein [Methanobacterium subterraneum]AUB61225.1 CAAX protease family protein [Methanobacterium subterraneum]NMO10107.1 CPBP family intramembrane metalloprotease [Methanobacterium subterraneum]